MDRNWSEWPLYDTELHSKAPPASGYPGGDEEPTKARGTRVSGSLYVEESDEETTKMWRRRRLGMKQILRQLLQGYATSKRQTLGVLRMQSRKANWPPMI